MSQYSHMKGKHFAVLVWNSSYSGSQIHSSDKVIKLDGRLNLKSMKAKARELANEHGFKCFFIRRGPFFHLTLPEHMS